MHSIYKIRLENLKKLMATHGDSQTSLAKKLGKTPQYVNNLIKMRRNIGPRVALELCSAYNIEPEQLDLPDIDIEAEGGMDNKERERLWGVIHDLQVVNRELRDEIKELRAHPSKGSSGTARGNR